MNSFIGWVGGKKQLRHKIIEQFPSVLPNTYIEVFGGAGWVLFAKEKLGSQLEVFNDIDSNLINLYRCVQHHPQEVIKELEYTMLSSNEIFHDFKGQIDVRGLTDIQRAVRYLYMIKFSFGCAKHSYGNRKRRIDKTLERLDEIQERLQGVVIENKDFESLIKLYDSEKSFFYLDPPYHGTEKLYKNNADRFSEADHYRLCELLENIKGKFLLSYNDDEFVRKLYKDFSIEGVTRKNSLAANSDNRSDFKELIIKNY